MESSVINWQELTASAAVCGVFIWGITKGLPSLIKTFAEDSAETRGQFTLALNVHRDDFTEALSSQRTEFRDDLAVTREQSRQLAQSGHDAVHRVADSVEQLTEKIDKMHGSLATPQKNGS
tara:strand:+ start:2976 stop:3338 length:363 start_codon:yes stop_codon:yes gene_type:complete